MIYSIQNTTFICLLEYNITMVQGIWEVQHLWVQVMGILQPNVLVSTLSMWCFMSLLDYRTNLRGKVNSCLLAPDCPSLTLGCKLNLIAVVRGVWWLSWHRISICRDLNWCLLNSNSTHTLPVLASLDVSRAYTWQTLASYYSTNYALPITTSLDIGSLYLNETFFIRLI